MEDTHFAKPTTGATEDSPEPMDENPALLDQEIQALAAVCSCGGNPGALKVSSFGLPPPAEMAVGFQR